METINVEEFKRNIKACLDQLPFAVTRRGKVLCVCYGPEGMPVDVPEKVKKQECNDMPIPSKSPVASNSEVENPADKPVIAKVEPEAGKPLANGYIPKSASQLKAEYKNNHPMDICQGCHNFNRDCVCGATVYEPEPVRTGKQPKQSASRQAQPIVNAMLSGIKARPTVAHHPTCTCAMCKPA